MADKASLIVIEGPNGAAEVFELSEDEAGAATQTRYLVEFGGVVTEYLTMGEAYIDAGVLSGTAT